MTRRLTFVLWLVLLGAGLAACTPREQPYHADARHEVELKSDMFIAPDGMALPYRSWLPKGKFKAVLVALHGFNDYSRAFVGTGEYLSARGVAVYAYDQRGFGKTSMAGIWGGKKNFTSDLAAWVAYLKGVHPDCPIYVLGESMGAVVAINALTSDGFPPVDGVILSAPAVWGGEAMNPFYRIMAAVSAHMIPGYTMTGSDLKIQATDNMEILRQMSLDPLVIKATRVDAMYGLVNLMDDAYENMPQVNTPVLLLYGGKDEVISEQIIGQSMRRLSGNFHCIYYPGGYHMLLRDKKAKIVWQDIHQWLWINKENIQLTTCKRM